MLKRMLLMLPILCCMFTGLSAKELVFATQDFKPFSYQDNGKPAGAGVEIVLTACKKAGIDAKIDFYPWTRAQKYVENGEAQGLFILAKTPEREKILDFSIPLIESEYALFVSADDQQKYENAKDFNGKIIGVYGPSGTSASLDKMAIDAGNIKNIDMSVDDIAAFKKLNIKRVDAVYSNRDVGEMLVKDLKLDKVKYALTHKKITYYIAFSKKAADKELVKNFEEALSALKKSGELKKILDKYDILEAK